jgi:uncharacterized protein
MLKTTIMEFKKRDLHRDLGYFYLGLIISFAISGILQNHRDSWKPEKYVVESKKVQVNLPQKEEEITEEFAQNLAEKLVINDKFRRFNIKKGELRLYFEKTEVEIDIKTGEGEAVSYRDTPLISQFHTLHKSTSPWWIYYSDFFGICILTIAITGATMIPKGKMSFSSRGWKLALMGLFFPLIFLFLLT